MRSYTARWVCPVVAPPIPNGCVTVSREGVIAYVGDSAGAPNAPIEDLGSVVLTPGLVNTHTHLDLTLFRGMIPECRFFEWIREVLALKRHYLTESVRLASARLGIAEGIRAGVTTYADTSDSGANVLAMRSMGVRGICYHEVFGPDASQRRASMEGLKAMVNASLMHQNARVAVGISPHAPYSVSNVLFEACAGYASQRALPIAVHIAESRAEVDYVSRGTGPFASALLARGISVSPRARSPIALLEQTGVLACRPLLIHAVKVNSEDIGLMASSRSGVAHCAISNARLGNGCAPVLRMLNAGIPVGIGTDSVISNNRMDLLTEARLAAMLQLAARNAVRGIDADTLLELLTLKGAMAIGLEKTIGSLEVGKQGDLAAFSLDGLNGAPGPNPAETLLFSLQGGDAVFTMVGGEVLMSGGRLLCDIADDMMLIKSTLKGAALF